MLLLDTTPGIGRVQAHSVQPICFCFDLKIAKLPFGWFFVFQSLACQGWQCKLPGYHSYHTWPSRIEGKNGNLRTCDGRLMKMKSFKIVFKSYFVSSWHASITIIAFISGTLRISRKLARFLLFFIIIHAFGESRYVGILECNICNMSHRINSLEIYVSLMELWQVEFVFI